jgi:hypothetical protein
MHALQIVNHHMEVRTTGRRRLHAEVNFRVALLDDGKRRRLAVRKRDVKAQHVPIESKRPPKIGDGDSGGNSPEPWHIELSLQKRSTGLESPWLPSV